MENALEGGFSVRAVDPEQALGAFKFFEDEVLSAEESACAFRLPIIGEECDLGLRVHRYRTVMFQPSSSSDGTSRIQVGVNMHRGVARPVEITEDDVMHHLLALGATGTGKSTWLLDLVLQISNAGHGLALVDPAGDLADEFLARYPRGRSEDLMIVDFNDRDFPVPLNLLAWESVEERDLIIDTLYGTLRSVYQEPEFFGPVFEQYFRSGLRLLMGDQLHREDFTPTMLEFPQVLRNPKFRAHLLSRLRDEEVIDAVEEADRVTSSEYSLRNIAPYVNSKFARFLQDTQLRRIIGHGKMALNFRHAMDSGKIVVFKLAQGRLGKHVADVLVAQIVARFYLAATSRADVPRERRRPYFLVCDEASAICDENVAGLLSQSRKYSLALVLATQYLKQLEARGVLEAVLGNVGTLAAFRMSADDARLLEPVFWPVVGAHDLVECPHWNGYMKLNASRVRSRAVSFQTICPDPATADPAWANELTERSRRQWGVSAEEIDRRIEARRRFVKDIGRKPSPKPPSSENSSDDWKCVVLPDEYDAPNS